MSANTEKEFVNAIAAEMASSVARAVERWMAEFDSVLQDPHLTTPRRLQAVQAIVARYRHLRGLAECPRQPIDQVGGRDLC
ncbi:MAG: hypothetical protein JO266_15565 [Acidobacteria bacterium]|nr:hypothetical protein [Acidobacteriota bacterium]MBV9483162.1 hypothetical protein [Acidobacteriota bacterium]